MNGNFANRTVDKSNENSRVVQLGTGGCEKVVSGVWDVNLRRGKNGW